MICPKCGLENDDNWPLDIGGEIKEGGCQMCWETYCGEAYHRTMVAIEIAQVQARFDAFIPLGAD